MTVIDGLRAVAALVVILPHAWVLFDQPARQSGRVDSIVFFVRLRGTLGVQVFFVLSGFVIAYSLRSARVTGQYLARFAVRRSIRLDPAYWVGIAVSCGVVWLQARVARDGAMVPTVGQVLTTAVYLQQILGCNDAVNHTYWTLCIEVQLYLAYCAAIGLAQAVRVPYRWLLPVAFVVSLAWPLGVWPSPRGLFLPHACGFLAGATAWWAVGGGLPPWVATAAGGLGLAAAARHGDVIIYTVVVTAGLLVVAGRSGGLYRWLNYRPLQAIGRASYGLYLLHNPIIWLARMGQLRMGWTGLGSSVAILAGVCVASVAAAGVLHVTVERPCLRWGRRLRDPRRGGPEPADVDVPLVPA